MNCWAVFGISNEGLAMQSMPLDHCYFPLMYFSMRMKK